MHQCRVGHDTEPNCPIGTVGGGTDCTSQLNARAPGTDQTAAVNKAAAIPRKPPATQTRLIPDDSTNHLVVQRRRRLRQPSPVDPRSQRDIGHTSQASRDCYRDPASSSRTIALSTSSDTPASRAPASGSPRTRSQTLSLSRISRSRRRPPCTAALLLRPRSGPRAPVRPRRRVGDDPATRPRVLRRLDQDHDGFDLAICHLPERVEQRGQGRVTGAAEWRGDAV